MLGANVSMRVSPLAEKLNRDVGALSTLSSGNNRYNEPAAIMEDREAIV